MNEVKTRRNEMLTPQLMVKWMMYNGEEFVNDGPLSYKFAIKDEIERDLLIELHKQPIFAKIINLLNKYMNQSVPYTDFQDLGDLMEVLYEDQVLELEVQKLYCYIWNTKNLNTTILLR